MDIEEIADALVDEGAFTVEEEDLIELLIMVEEGKQSATEEKESDTNEIIEYLIDSDIDLTTIIDELES